MQHQLKSPGLNGSVQRRLAGLLLVLAATCALGEAGEGTPHSYHIGFSQDTLANDWRIAQARDLSDAFAGHPEVRVTVTDGKAHTAKQIQDIEDLAFSGIDLLIASPKDSAAVTPLISRLHRRGLPVVMLTRRIDSDDYTTYVGPDDERIARAAARFMADRLNGRGDILMLKGVPTASTAILRTQGFLEEIRNHPGIRVVAVKTANYLRGDAIQAIEEALGEGLRFDAIFAQSDSMASGARMALRRAGLDPASLLIVGMDYITEAREAIRSGEQTASFTYPTCGREGAGVALRILRGEAVPKRVVIDSVMVTRDNVENVEPIF